MITPLPTSSTDPVKTEKHKERFECPPGIVEKELNNNYDPFLFYFFENKYQVIAVFCKHKHKKRLIKVD